MTFFWGLRLALISLIGIFFGIRPGFFTTEGSTGGNGRQAAVKEEGVLSQNRRLPASFPIRKFLFKKFGKIVSRSSCSNTFQLSD